MGEGSERFPECGNREETDDSKPARRCRRRNESTHLQLACPKYYQQGANSMRSICVTLFSVLLSFIVLAAAPTSPASAQSFNCRYARTPDEVRVCNSLHLRGEDERLSEKYSRLRNEVGGAERRRLIREQRAWLNQRRACGSDHDCLARAYRMRADELDAGY